MFKKIALAAVALLFLAIPAFAQSAPAKVNEPWLMLSRLTSAISVSGTTGDTALPTQGLTAWVTNTGSTDAYFTLGYANTVTTTTTTGDYLKAGTCSTVDLFPIGASGPFTYIALITASSTTTVTIEAGIGEPPCMAAAGSGGGGSVTQGTSPWVVSGQGSAGTAAAGVVTVQGIASMVPFLNNPGTPGNWGIGAIGAAVPGNASYGGCIGSTADPTAVTTGNLQGIECGLNGKQIVTPYALKELALRGAGSSASTGTTITLLPASGTAGQYEYLTDLECYNTSSTNVYVTLNDINASGSAVSSIIAVPATYGGNNKSFETPLRGPNNGALTATLSANASTIYCNGQGYSGS
jgi:hypothetical protein